MKNKVITSIKTMASVQSEIVTVNAAHNDIIKYINYVYVQYFRLDFS